jgi:hypothetical protein
VLFSYSLTVVDSHLKIVDLLVSQLISLAPGLFPLVMGGLFFPLLGCRRSRVPR